MQAPPNTPYNSVTVARFLRATAASKGKSLNATQTQKLLYILYGLYASRDIAIIDEEPEAWPYGPVFRKTHSDYDPFNTPNINAQEFEVIKTNQEFVHTVGAIVDRYGSISATKLSSWSHTNGSPWDRVINVENNYIKTIIPRSYIRDYFVAKRIID